MRIIKYTSVHKSSRFFYTLVFASLLFSCRTAYQPTTTDYVEYKISAQLPKDQELVALTAPYRDSMNKIMSTVIGIAGETLERKQPESNLGNFMADMMLYAGNKVFGDTVDAAFVNYHGMRITVIPKGQVTVGKIFELMPFQNLVVLQRVKGDILQRFLDLTAAEGGWPVAGITMKIVDKKATDVKIKGEPLDPSKTYNIINSDYIATGGDNAVMLQSIPHESSGYLMRDAIFDYIKELQRQGKTISSKVENRVTDGQ
jgi:2',3'-cyclic-nucleotide 2'-phosphodiesterase (5'-nucleotidase family)